MGKVCSKKIPLINSFHDHYVLKTSHPSSFYAYMSFLGSKHFEKTFSEKKRKKNYIL